jgi:hypothetical protein
MFITGVNDTGEKFIAGGVDTGDTIYIFPVSLISFRKKPKSLKFIAGVDGVNDKVLPILACLHLKIRNKQNFNL